jgi:hypothetical protein
MDQWLIVLNYCRSTSICIEQFVKRYSRVADGYNHSFYSGNPMKGEHHDAGIKR